MGKTIMKKVLTVLSIAVLTLGLSTAPAAFAAGEDSTGHHPGGHHHDGGAMPPVVVVPGTLEVHLNVDVDINLTTSGLAIFQDGSNTQVNAITNVGDADLVGVSAYTTAILNIANLGYACNGCEVSGVVVQTTQMSAINATFNGGSVAMNGNEVGGTQINTLAGGNFFNVTSTSTGAP
jgi:hypothetical protein